MSHIRPTGTSIELILEKALWAHGYRYRKNYRKLPGTPDIVLTKSRIAIFCDSEFFHGKDWDETLREQIRRGSRPEYWEAKILRNMERDTEVNQKLRALGWTVVRFWGNDIKKDPEECVKAVDEAVWERKIGEEIE